MISVVSASRGIVSGKSRPGRRAQQRVMERGCLLLDTKTLRPLNGQAGKIILGLYFKNPTIGIGSKRLESASWTLTLRAEEGGAPFGSKPRQVNGGTGEKGFQT